MTKTNIEKFEESYNQFQFVYKFYQMRREGATFPIEEMVEMLKYFESVENFEFCEYLKNKITQNGISHE